MCPLDERVRVHTLLSSEWHANMTFIYNSGSYETKMKYIRNRRYTRRCGFFNHEIAAELLNGAEPDPPGGGPGPIWENLRTHTGTEELTWLT